jgi:hypothetical protein
MMSIIIMMFPEKGQNINPAKWITKNGRMTSE